MQMPRKIVLKSQRAFGQEVEGEALVSRDPIHFVMDIGAHTGIGIGVGHDLYGKNVAGRVLVIPAAKGGVASSMAIAQLVKDGCGPKALIYDRSNPIMVQGAILANIPIMEHFNKNPVEVIESGDWVRVKPAERVVETERK
jgi:predicted aconitase with swiveling domain